MSARPKGSAVPGPREVGFALSSLSVVVLLLGALWGVARQVF